MDAAYRNPTRRFPSYTDAQLEASLTNPNTNPAQFEAIKTELANRKAGISKAFATPQVTGGMLIIGRFKS